jgi:hypothetical protein
MEIHLAGKTTKKRQNSHTSRRPAHAQHLPTTLNGETRRAPTLPDANFYPVWETTRWDNDRTSTQTPAPDGCWRTSTKSIKTETLLHLNLGNFIYLFIYLFIFFFLSSLCLSNVCLARHWLLHYLSLFISSALFFSFAFFPFFFTFFAFPLLSPFHSRYHHHYYYKLDDTELHTVQGH